MSLRAIRWAMEQRAGSATAKVVLLALAEAANPAGQAFPSQARLSEVTELKERAIRDALATLETVGLIRRERRYRKGGSRDSDRYLLSIPAPDAGEAPKAAPGAGKGGSIPAPDAALVPTVLEPEDIPPLSPAGGPHANGGNGTGRKHPLPPEWTPTEGHRQLARERGVSLEAEAEKLRDWAQANAAKKVDWDATFRNWLRNSRPEPKRTNGGNGIHLRPEQLRTEPESAEPVKTRLQIEHERRLRAAGGAR